MGTASGWQRGEEEEGPAYACYPGVAIVLGTAGLNDTYYALCHACSALHCFCHNQVSCTATRVTS